MRSLDLGAVIASTENGILNFVKSLGSGNKGLVLSVVNINTDRNFCNERALIGKTIIESVQGELARTSDTRDISNIQAARNLTRIGDS